MLEILKHLQGGLSRLEDGQRQTNERLAAIEHHMAGFHMTQVSYMDELSTLRNRVERIERRLDLVPSQDVRNVSTNIGLDAISKTVCGRDAAVEPIRRYSRLVLNAVRVDR
ncbi:MAG: hypothetical protein HC808_12940 [Candidatus Competibacteraceae bacterium]|nr:hypothetical protein [Candidatus Competibacteraceae bacterium]